MGGGPWCFSGNRYPFHYHLTLQNNALQKSPSTNHQQGPPPTFPSLLAPLPAPSAPNCPLQGAAARMLCPTGVPAHTAPAGRGRVPGAHAAAATAAASPPAS